MSGIGLYWCIVECLYENNGYLDLDQINLLAYELRVEKKLIEDLIDNYDLFKKNKKTDSSATALQSEYKEKENKIKENKKKIKENILITTTNLFEYIESNFGRPLSPLEYEKANHWLSLYDQEIIEYAVKIAVMNGKRTFNYVEGILNNWKGKDLKSIKDITEDNLRILALKHRDESKEKIEIFDYDWLNDPDIRNEEGDDE